MMEYIKTTISREKLLKKDFSRDTIEKIKIEDKEVIKVDKYKALIDILTQKYIENNNT